MTTATAVGFVEMRIAKVVGLGAADERPVQYVVVDEVAGDRQLAIEIGQAEAFSMAAPLGGMAWRRPMTYQFVAALVEDVYLATVEEGPLGMRSVDARPSDALNLVALVQAPILVAAEVGATPWEGEVMSEPNARRPYMPGYGIVGPGEGRGLLPWSWAEERLIASHDYWVATVWPDGRPHVMPVWGVWNDEAVWFSSSVRSRKARNLRADPRCVVTTDNAVEPVVLEGVAEVVRDPGAIEELVSLVNEKYASDLTVGFLDPEVNATFRVRPRWVFSLSDKEFTDSPTRWEFSGLRGGPHAS